MFDMHAVYNRILKQLKVPAINEIMPNPDGLKESNPALENVSMSMNRPAAAYPDQDHISHIKIHMAYAQDPNYGGNPLIGPTFAPHAVEHIKQHLTLHYLQSMRATVATAAGGEDAFKLNQEQPLDIEAQRALALASQLVSQDSQQLFAPIQPGIQQLVQKVQQMQQAKQQSLLNNDPTAQVLLKTQMAETQRKTQEFQTKIQSEMQRAQQEYQLKVAELQQKVNELQAKYTTQTNIDNQRNATDIAMANINNAAKERVAMITANAQMDQQQQQLEHEQDLSAMEAIHASNADIRQHGLAIEQQNFQAQANMVKQQAQQDAQYQSQAQLAAQQHNQQLQQNQQQADLQPEPQPQQPTEGQ
jgi:hypothetical protein